MQASSSPLLPLGAVRTVYPKVSRNAFSHSSTSGSSSMQRRTGLRRGLISKGRIVHLEAALPPTLAQLKLRKCSILHTSEDDLRCSSMNCVVDGAKTIIPRDRATEDRGTVF